MSILNQQLKFNKYLLSLILIVFALFASSLQNSISAQENDDNSNPPEYAGCLQRQPPGDWSHYSDGLHQIVGNGLLPGSDDVYSLSDGNFLQCFCGKEDNGIETIWWRTDLHIDGWFSENGSQWNLGDYHYLAKNQDYFCGAQPTSTPCPSVTPTPTAVPTVTPVATPTNNPNDNSGKHSSLGKTNPTCENLDFEVIYSVLENGNPIKDVNVTFVYLGNDYRKTKTDEHGDAKVIYHYNGKGEIKVDADQGFSSQAINVDELICPALGGGNILSSSTINSRDVGLGGQVLGTDTDTLAATGVFSENLNILFRAITGFILGFGSVFKIARIKRD